MYAPKCKVIGAEDTEIEMKVEQIDNTGKAIKTLTYVRLSSLDTFGWLDQS